MTLGKHEHVVGAWAESGWSTSLIWVCVQDSRDGSYRLKAIQVDEMSAPLAVLLHPAVAMSAELIAWVKALEVKTPKRRREGGAA